MAGGAFAVLLLQNLRSAAAKPARSKGFGRAFAADSLQKQQTAAGTGKFDLYGALAFNSCSGDRDRLSYAIAPKTSTICGMFAAKFQHIAESDVGCNPSGVEIPSITFSVALPAQIEA